MKGISCNPNRFTLEEQSRIRSEGNKQSGSTSGVSSRTQEGQTMVQIWFFSRKDTVWTSENGQKPPTCACPSIGVDVLFTVAERILQSPVGFPSGSGMVRGKVSVLESLPLLSIQVEQVTSAGNKSPILWVQVQVQGPVHRSH